MKQLAFKIPQWGGQREGAGRKLRAERPRVSHKTRLRFDRAAAVLVTLRVASDVRNLRTKRSLRIIEDCFASARARFGLRLIEFAVMGNHLHLLVEADSDLSLSRGMQGLGVRLSRRLNKLMQRRGSFFDDHYHAHLLDSPTKLVNAIGYVLGNHEHHYGPSDGIDPYSSLACDRMRLLCSGQTWLVRIGWRRAKGVRSPWLDRWIAAQGAAEEMLNAA